MKRPPQLFKLLATLLALGSLHGTCQAGTAVFELTDGSLAPTLSADMPKGVTVSDLTIGTGLGDLTDNGANVNDGDFDELSGVDITFYLPWVDYTNSEDVHMDIDNLSIGLLTTDSNPDDEDPNGSNTGTSTLSIKNISLQMDSNLTLDLAGASDSTYFVLRSNDLKGPAYRKRWVSQDSGSFPSDQTELTWQQPLPAASQAFYIAATAEPKARIICVGDSITEGTSNECYRPDLYDLLQAAGYHFEFVGSKSTSYDGVDLAYEAYSGYSAVGVKDQFVAHFPSHIADIVLIHAGHNYDATQYTEGEIISHINGATREMIATARSNNPDVIILLAQVITSSKLPKYSYIPALNEDLAALATELNSDESPIILVNQADGWDPVADTSSDMVHPTAAGALKMANKWFEALSPWLE